MAKGKGKKNLNKGKNPLKVNRIKLVRRKAEASEPVACLYAGNKYPSLTAAAKDKKRSRTYVSRVADRI